jgi:hypothetical protein
MWLQPKEGELQLRIAAAKHWIIQDEHDSKYAALTKFKKEMGHKGDGKDGRYIKRWGKHFLEKGHVYDCTPPGPPPSITDLEALEAAYLFGSDQFQTIEEGVDKVPYLKLLVEHKLKGLEEPERALWRRMQQVEPALGKNHTQEHKRGLNEEQKQDRVKFSKELRGKNSSYFDRIVWLDCKGMWLKRLGTGKKVMVYGIKCYPEYDNLLQSNPNYSKSGCHLKWYSGVNRRVGHVFLQWVSGTTGFKPQAGTHEVSAYLLFYNLIRHGLSGYPTMPHGAGTDW